MLFFLINVLNENSKNGLLFSLENKNFEISKLLIEKNININNQDNDGKTSLHHSLDKGYIDISLFFNNY